MTQIPSPSVCRGPNIVRGGFQLSPDLFCFLLPEPMSGAHSHVTYKTRSTQKRSDQALEPIWLVSCRAVGFWFSIWFRCHMMHTGSKTLFFERHNPLLYHAWSMGRRCARHAEDPGNSTNRKSNLTGFMCNWAAYWNKRGPVPLHWVLIPGPSQATGAGWREFFLWTDKRMLRISLLIKHVSNIFLNSALFTSIFTGEQSSSSSSSFLVLCYVSPGMSSPSVEQHETGKYVDHAVRKIQTQRGTHSSKRRSAGGVKPHLYHWPCQLKKKCWCRGCYFWKPAQTAASVTHPLVSLNL